MRPAFVYLYSSTVAGANAVPLIRSNSGNNYLEVRNGIIWGTDPQKDVIGSTARTVAYTDLMNANLAGAGNINTDPKFVNPANGDYRLQASSPCINTAGPEHIAATDLDGAPRVQGGTLDMGAYEFWVAASGNWFVDKALGNDITGTGAPGNPYKTVVKAISSASNGHRIYTKAGNYGTDRPRITKNLKFYNWKATGRASIGKP